ncbi:MAG TPA: hypothetical protein VG273_22560 [Bryobacteraceae bacterium]|jgi:hypothetical protein|nr:hypothetical protein [Bryobacteraceae bacterium]
MDPLAKELIDRILSSSRIPSERRRREIQRELGSHVEDFVDAARTAGRDEGEIEQMVAAHFGDPARIARELAWIYRHDRRRLRIFVFMISTVLLASCLSAAILTVQAGLAIGFGTSIMKVLASRHTVIEALDIVASVAAYLGVTLLEELFDRHRFQKAAALLAAILLVLSVLCGAAGLRAGFLVFGLVNGLFFRALQLFITRGIARASIVAVCFPLTGIVIALLRMPGSPVAFAATCASWLAMGAGYQVMTHVASRVDTALVNGLQRIHAG